MSFPTVTARSLSAELADPRRRESALSEIYAAIDQENGNATQAAASLGVSWRAFRRWAQTYPAIQARLEQHRAARKRRT